MDVLSKKLMRHYREGENVMSYKILGVLIILQILIRLLLSRSKKDESDAIGEYVCLKCIARALVNQFH
jgi:hypothetical protein